MFVPNPFHNWETSAGYFNLCSLSFTPKDEGNVEDDVINKQWRHSWESLLGLVIPSRNEHPATMLLSNTSRACSIVQQHTLTTPITDAGCGWKCDAVTFLTQRGSGIILFSLVSSCDYLITEKKWICSNCTCWPRRHSLLWIQFWQNWTRLEMTSQLRFSFFLSYVAVRCPSLRYR